MTKLYLAGKIAKSDWRHQIVPGLRDSNTAGGGGWSDAMAQWPTRPTIYSGVEYVGPYFISCDHGCAHGPNQHGVGATTGVEGNAYPSPGRERTFELCLEAIKRCDVFFAWLDASADQDGVGICTAYGTLVEIGMARALKKTVIVASTCDPEDEDCTGGHGCVCGNDDLWFARKSAWWAISASDPLDAIKQMTTQHVGNFKGTIFDHFRLNVELGKLLESPLEEDFWKAYVKLQPAELSGLVPQHKLTVSNKSYRLDFAIPERRIAFEMDGRTYHDTDKAFANDRRRDLNLELAGWRVHRFDGDYIRHDPEEIVRIAARLAGADQ